MKKVMLYAYTNFNLGDDLFLKIICERYPHTNFLIYAPKEYKELLRQYENVKVYPNDGFFIKVINYTLRKLGYVGGLRRIIANKCDGGVYIGGSLFMQRDNWKTELDYKRKMNIKGKPFFLLGANFGPYIDEQFYNGYKKIFKEYTDICFREQYSYNMFKDLPNVRWSDDIIFQLSNNVKVSKQEDYVAISVIKPSIRKDLIAFDNIYYKKIKEIAVYFIEKGIKIKFISFCGNEGDDDAIEEIVRMIPKKYIDKVSKHLYKNNIDETLNVLSKSKLLVATRFHSMILGWVYNKPVFPIAYSEKMTNVITDIGFDGDYIDFKNIHKLEPWRVFKSMNANRIDISRQIIQAESHFKVLDDYLN